MSLILGRRHRLLHVRALLTKRIQRRTRNLSSTPWISSRFLTTPRAPLREEARGPPVLHRQFAQEEVQK